MNAISLGIIGCGRVTQELHLPALRSVPKIKVTALADVIPEQLRKTADAYGISCRYETGKDLIDNAAVDAIAVCTPPESHHDLTLQALGVGKHVFVEKPLALSVAHGEAMVQGVFAAGRVAAIGFNLRCHRLVRQARDVVASGDLGEIVQIVTNWSTPVVHHVSGGVLFDLGVHHVDACCFILADSITDTQMLARNGTEEFTSASLLARTSNGASISSSFSYAGAAVNEFRIVGKKKSLFFSLYDATSFNLCHSTHPSHGWRTHLHRLRSLGNLPSLTRIAWSGGDFLLSYREQWRGFARAIRNESPPIATFEDGLTALKLLHAATANAK